MVLHDDFVEAKLAAETLGFSAQYTRLLVRQGKLSGVKIARDWLITKESISIFINSRLTVPLLPERKRGRPCSIPRVNR